MRNILPPAKGQHVLRCRRDRISGDNAVRWASQAIAELWRSCIGRSRMKANRACTGASYQQEHHDVGRCLTMP